MTTTQIIILCLAAFVFVFDVFMGLRYRSMTPEMVAHMRDANGQPPNLDGLHLVGNVLLASAPVLSGILVWVALVKLA